MKLVIGYGNPLRGDDAFGPRVVEELASHCDPQHVRCLVRHSLTPEIAAELAAAERVVFVDAAVTGEPGELSCRKLAAAVAESAQPAAIPHVLEPRTLVTLARTLYDATPDCYLVSVRAETLAWSANRLSQRVATTLPAAIKRVQALLEE